ncbi:hypothetical protein M422DRAFT_270284 [Sphaerobolus stellatus SS14]|uniref:Hydrophobin n=1 Tax=Sphaerobolus stellatus (strain SS14) TaxID=990650 RepID=A0A0C9U2S1_SPHS4|nr:hypothetical protein M422DRAFT_270284 [Sphaerobolus stellatus SS14]
MQLSRVILAVVTLAVGASAQNCDPVSLACPSGLTCCVTTIRISGGPLLECIDPSECVDGTCLGIRGTC